MRLLVLLLALLFASAAAAQSSDTLVTGRGCVGAACAKPPRTPSPQWPVPDGCLLEACLPPSPTYREMGLNRREAVSINAGTLVGGVVGTGLALAAVPPSTPDGAFGLGLLGVWVMGGLAGAGVGALAGYIAAQ